MPPSVATVLWAAVAARQPAPAQPADPGAAAPRLEATGAGQASSFGPGRTIGRRVGGGRKHKVPEKFCLSLQHSDPARAELSKVYLSFLGGPKVRNAETFPSSAPVRDALPHRPAAVEQAGSPSRPAPPRPGPSRTFWTAAEGRTPSLLPGAMWGLQPA